MGNRLRKTFVVFILVFGSIIHTAVSASTSNVNPEIASSNVGDSLRLDFPYNCDYAGSLLSYFREDDYVVYDLLFAFPFYGYTYSGIHMGSNGHVTFARGYYSWSVTWYAVLDRGGTFGKVLGTEVWNCLNFKKDWGESIVYAGEGDMIGFRAERTYIAVEGGTYRFSIRTDDGMRVFLDGQQIINGWKVQEATSYHKTVQLQEGRHEIVVEWFEWGIHAYAEFSIELAVMFDADPRIGSITVDGNKYTSSQLPKSFFWTVDSYHSFSVDSMVHGGTGVQHIFTGWNDGHTDTSRTVRVTEPANYIANYRTEYYLTVNSEYGDPQGEGWYDAGSVATFSVTSPMNAGFGVQYVFDHWSGDIYATTPNATVVMNYPHTVTAVWRTDYSQLYFVTGTACLVVAVSAITVWALKKRKPGPPKLPPTAPPPPALPVETKPVVKSMVPKVSTADLDDAVHEYIVQHEGVISISQAVKDLGISTEELKASTERLQKAGKLMKE